MNPTATIAAVVVSHESAATIDDCLSRLRDADGVAQIRVVDNSSTDGSLQIVQRHAAADARVRFIGNPDNPGFAVACNQGVRDCDAPWLAFVNPDCLVDRDTLTRLRAHALAGGSEALIGTDLVDAAGVRDGAARRRDPDFVGMLASPFAGRLGAALAGSKSRRLDIAIDHATTLQPVDAISGALMLLPRGLFARIDGFDERYRLHAEDLDLCRRARDVGALVAVANDVRVTHLRGVSSRARPLFVEWHKHRGLARYFGKFEAPRRGLLMRLAVYVAIWLRFPIATLRALARL
ncbi:MAG: glycosyltransferase family 2 protein [Luteimonas sp.]